MTKHIDLPAIAERDRILDMKQSAAMAGFSLVHYRRLVQTGKAPKPIVIGARKQGNRVGTMLDFIASKEVAA